jgi:hypothetical protein
MRHILGLRRLKSAPLKERNQRKVKIHRQFSIESARNKPNRHCRNVFADKSQDENT